MRSSKTPTSFAAILLSFTVLLAIFISNIGAMLVIASITVTMARSLKIKPQILLIFQSVVINLGGMLLWMGSIPNIIIGLEGGLSFMDFVFNMLPLGIILFIVTLLVFIRSFRQEFSPEPEAEFMELEFDEWMERAIEVSGLKVSGIDSKMIFAAIIMILMIFGFMTYESFNLTPAVVALSAGIAMMIVQSKEPAMIFKEIDWSTILFLAGMFVMINSLAKIGVIEAVSINLSRLLGKSPLRASIIIMWISGIVSSLVDNIPLSTSIAPIVKDLIYEESWTTLWWGLVIGANLGGSITPIGSPSSIIAIGVSEQEGYPISFSEFLKIGVGLTLIYFMISMIYLYIRYTVLQI
jgi:Na+/H+ antiporter NhaD/arsenite permease-like protein